MLNQMQIEKLKSNWGDRAESLSCYAEVRLFDPFSEWQCFILSINPDDEDEIYCILSPSLKMTPEVTFWCLSDIFLLYNENGEGVKIDLSYRPIFASSIIKKLSELKTYGI